MTLFGIWLEKPLCTKEIRPRHSRMRNPQPNPASVVVIEVLLIEQVDDVESYQHLLLIPRKSEHVRN